MSDQLIIREDMAALRKRSVLLRKYIKNLISPITNDQLSDLDPMNRYEVSRDVLIVGQPVTHQDALNRIAEAERWRAVARCIDVRAYEEYKAISRDDIAKICLDPHDNEMLACDTMRMNSVRILDEDGNKQEDKTMSHMKLERLCLGTSTLLIDPYWFSGQKLQ